jgi:hypothetical protein
MLKEAGNLRVENDQDYSPQLKTFIKTVFQLIL